MKKLVLTVVSAVVTVASAYAAAPQALYLPNDIGYGWNYSAPEMARDGNKFSYMLEGKSADNDMFFFVSSKRADDWNGYTASGFNGLYGVSGDNGDATDARTIGKGSYDVYPYGVLKHCYRLEKGTKYVVTMDFSTNPAKMEVADGNAAPENLISSTRTRQTGGITAMRPLSAKRMANTHTSSARKTAPISSWRATDVRHGRL